MAAHALAEMGTLQQLDAQLVVPLSGAYATWSSAWPLPLLPHPFPAAGPACWPPCLWPWPAPACPSPYHFWPYSSCLEILLKFSVNQPWLVWLSGLSAGQRTKCLPFQFPVRAHAWVAGQVPSGGHVRGNHTLPFLSFSSSLSLFLKINK